MMHEFVSNLDGTTTIKVDFSDEGVQLIGETSIKGDAVSYLPVFEEDLRRNFPDKFPMPIVISDTNGGMI